MSGNGLEWADKGIAAFSAVGGAAVMWLVSLRTSRREDHKAEDEATQGVIRALQAGLEEQRKEIARLRERVEYAEQSEQRCQDRIMLLREELHALRNALMRAGVALPPLPAE